MMKKYILVLVVLVLVISVAGIARSNPVWASILPESWRSEEITQSEVFSPPLKKITITEDGLYNVGGVCTIEVDFLKVNLQIIADSEVEIDESKLVPFSGDGHLLFPGCRFVHFKENKIVNPLVSEDGSAKVCFGASPNMEMRVWYYLENISPGSRVWKELPAWPEDEGRLVCASAPYTAVYMPEGKIVPKPGEAGTGDIFFPGGEGGSVVTPPSSITITSSGTYPVGGICLLKAQYYIQNLSDNVEVEYPSKHYTEETLTVPSEDVKGIFYFPGCHVLHFKDQVVKDQMFRDEGDWEICFAAIPDKIMTIYYYRDNMTVLRAPWIPLKSTTENGMVCAPLVDFSAVYAPAGE